MWSNFSGLHAALAIICLHNVPWFSSTPLNKTTQFANAKRDCVLCWGCSNELNEPVCLCVAISWGHNGKSDQLSFLFSLGNPLLTCHLYWITPTLIVSPNVSLRIVIAPHQHRISSIYVDTKSKKYPPSFLQRPLSKCCWARHLISLLIVPSELLSGPQWKIVIILGMTVFNCLSYWAGKD